MCLKFIWDERKNRQNIIKHGIDFTDLEAMFEHPLLVQLDSGKEHDEFRWVAIGWLRATLCLIIFSQPTEGCIRFISARKANKREVEQYEKVIRH